ncbi:hypothetical protein M569_16529 [Genlisea aurea]|uniref:FAS1 domain-containing protein n=1 Tax=Genlisea aurea TaxID=192259 RepID=S8D6J0_9LAMI|nr:hypothetical protein M569_16529 [Genlisea aurea]
MASLKSSLAFLILGLYVFFAGAQPSPEPRGSIVNAEETLAESGHTAMSLTLQLVADVLPFAERLTIFSPPDAAFDAEGQPSLNQLLLHFSPVFLSPDSLSSLPFLSTIPSLSRPNHLTVTSNATAGISIDDVGVSSQNPIFDDGSVIVYGVADFFQTNFTTPAANFTTLDLQCRSVETISRLEGASRVLKSRGYAIMAWFLDLQMMGFLDQNTLSDEAATKWTVFAPVDEELVNFSGDFLGYSSLFTRHLIPCRVRWNDLQQMPNATVISKNLNGFNLETSTQDSAVKINGVDVIFPEMYSSQWLVIHGISGVIPLPENWEIAAR